MSLFGPIVLEVRPSESFVIAAVSFVLILCLGFLIGGSGFLQAPFLHF